MNDEKPENAPTLNVKLESIEQSFEVGETSGRVNTTNYYGVEFNAETRGAGFLITVTAQMIIPATHKRKECEVIVTAKHYVESSDRRIFVKYDQQIAIQFTSEIGNQTLCYAKMYAKMELEKRWREKLKLDYQSFSGLYPQAKAHLTDNPVYRAL
jgi:hypothetical protein